MLIKKCVVPYIILLMGLLSACNFLYANFTGTIESIGGNTAIVKIKDGDILASGDEAGVDLSVAEDITFQVGDKVKVGYGNVGESDPLTIETIYVELVE